MIFTLESVSYTHLLRVAGLKKTLLESLGQGLRASTGYETAGSNGIAVLNLQSS